MASLAGTQLKDTYESLLKLSDNDALTATYKEVTDGEGAGTNLYVGTGGNVGIGTSSPTNYTNFTTLAIGDSVQGGVLELQYNGAQAARIAAVNPNTITLSTNNTERLRAYSGGDISLRDTSNNEAFYWDASEASLGIGNTSPASFLSGANVAVDVGNSSGGEFVARRTGGEANLAMGVTGGNIGYLYSTTNTPMVFGTNNAERMRIDSDGNVGINNVSPTVPSSNATTLHINGSVSTKGGAVRLSSSNSSIDALLYPSSSQFYIGTISNHDLGFYTNNTPRLTIDTSGNVGIGTDSPGTDLEVNGDGLTFRLDGTANTARGILLRNVGTATGEIKTDGNLDINIEDAGRTMRFLNGSTPRMTIDSSGNVLVGHTSAEGDSSGTTLYQNGQTVHKADGAYALELVRSTSDGDILTFRKDGSTVGSIGTFSSDLYIGTNDSGLRFEFAGTNAIVPFDVNSVAVSDNATDLGSGSARFKDLYLGGNVILASGQGIDFSATADATGMTSELLDDYEEGAWTPVVRGSGTAGTYELSSSYAYYTKVGRLVTIHLSIGLDDPITGGGSGYTQITGLPYAKASGFHTTAVVNSIGFDYTGDYLITRFTTAGDTSTKLGIFGNVDNGSLSLTPISGLSAGDSFTITVSYLT